jgi:hypothetical protein
MSARTVISARMDGWSTTFFWACEGAWRDKRQVELLHGEGHSGPLKPSLVSLNQPSPRTSSGDAELQVRDGGPFCETMPPWICSWSRPSASNCCRFSVHTTSTRRCRTTKEAPYKGQPSVLTSPNPLSTLHRRFACARLSQPCLPGSSSRRFRSAAGSADGVAPPAAHRTVHKPLDLHGSSQLSRASSR